MAEEAVPPLGVAPCGVPRLKVPPLVPSGALPPGVPSDPVSTTRSQ